uniref:Uncharacterized protein n=1 Tax=Glossina pallidipes TaxID=7398 RepID=A0A1A9Z274_GLOPL
MDCTMEDPAEEEFLPYGLDVVAFDDIVTGQIAKMRRTLLTGYGTAQYIHLDFFPFSFFPFLLFHLEKNKHLLFENVINE